MNETLRENLGEDCQPISGKMVEWIHRAAGVDAERNANPIDAARIMQTGDSQTLETFNTQLGNEDFSLLLKAIFPNNICHCALSKLCCHCTFEALGEFWRDF